LGDLPPSLQLADEFSAAGLTLVAYPIEERDASVRVIADASVSLVDHPGAERPGLDQIQRDVFGDRWKERRAPTDNVGVAEHAQLVDKAKLDGCRG
jgi:hypothetical protein